MPREVQHVARAAVHGVAALGRGGRRELVAQFGQAILRGAPAYNEFLALRAVRRRPVRALDRDAPRQRWPREGSRRACDQSAANHAEAQEH